MKLQIVTPTLSAAFHTDVALMVDIIEGAAAAIEFPDTFTAILRKRHWLLPPRYAAYITAHHPTWTLTIQDERKSE